MCSPDLTRGLCCLCFDTIYDGEHWTNDAGQKWDSHRWCHLMDEAMVARRDADIARKREGHPTSEELDRLERETLSR